VIGPWFLETFGTATGLAALHYAILLPPEALCLERIQSRADHGFRDLEAARHMYKEFATAKVAPRHVVVSTEEATALASRLHHLLEEGTLRRSVRPADSTLGRGRRWTRYEA
jgi:hypothetical protein